MTCPSSIFLIGIVKKILRQKRFSPVASGATDEKDCWLIAAWLASRLFLFVSQEIWRISKKVYPTRAPSNDTLPVDLLARASKRVSPNAGK